MTTPAAVLAPLFATLSALAFQGRATMAQTLTTFSHDGADFQRSLTTSTFTLPAWGSTMVVTLRVWDRVTHGVSTQTTTPTVEVAFPEDGTLGFCTPEEVLGAVAA